MKKDIFDYYANSVAKQFNITLEQLFTQTKVSHIVDARQILYYLCIERPIKKSYIKTFLQEQGYQVSHSTMEHGYKKAVQLIDGKEDMIEKDGIPNSQNIPLSTLHNNIWYHLGLAYYLKNDLPNALGAFQSCLESSNNDDMQVATRHWLYMIFRRMNLPEEAQLVLDPVHKEMTIIENEAYFNLLLFYKGELTIEEVSGNNSTGSSEAAKYGIANWHHYNGEISEAKKQYQQLIDNGNWAGFGYIAAEADLSRMK